MATVRAADGDGAASAETVFARVGGTVITLAAYSDYLRESIREKYYHGNVPKPELARFQREVGQRLVERTLLVAEAERRGIDHDADRVAQAEQRYDARFAGHPRWAENRERVLARVRSEVRAQSLVQRLEEQVREVPVPDENAVRSYFEQNPDQFTEPERKRVSVILLKVDPSSPSETWQAARERAGELAGAIRAGADFAELARTQSGDPSAANGGDMGYLHAGMLGDLAEQAIAAIEPGQVTEPVVLLEGVAIFRLEERTPARLNDFATVRARAAELARRDRGEQAWKSLIAELKKGTRVEIHEEHYLPLATSEADGS